MQPICTETAETGSSLHHRQLAGPCISATLRKSVEIYFLRKKIQILSIPELGLGVAECGGFMSVSCIISCPTLKEASTCRPEGQAQTDRRGLTDAEEADTHADPQKNLSLC